jgi:hypothetical protein
MPPAASTGVGAARSATTGTAAARRLRRVDDRRVDYLRSQFREINPVGRVSR